MTKDASPLGEGGEGGMGEPAASAGGARGDSAVSVGRGNLITSPYDKEIFALAVPALFSVLLDPMMGMVDTAIVGRLGTEPLAAVGLSTIIYNFSNFIWNFLLYTTTPRIAAAVSRKDDAGVSRITSQSLWVAGVIGLGMTLLLWNYCPAMFKAMGAKPEVMPHAVLYLRGRCIASPAILCFYVLSGTFRGYKDTVTPLMAGILSNVVHLGLDVALVFWLGMGVTGAALATSLSHWVTVGVLLGMVVRKGYLRLPDLVRVPSWGDVTPMLRSGFFLSTRSILAMAMLLWSTKLIAGFGAVSLAAHEILRQIFIFSNQAYTSLDIATQSLVAFYLGRSDKQRATDVFIRVSQLALMASVVVMAGLLAGRASLPAVFTKDAAVVQLVIKVLPVIAVFMPLDALASVMDGVLLGSQQASWMSQTMVATSAVCACALLGAQAMGLGILSIWCVIKFLTLGRCIGNSWRLLSKDSPLGTMSPAALSGGTAGS